MALAWVNDATCNNCCILPMSVVDRATRQLIGHHHG